MPISAYLSRVLRILEEDAAHHIRINFGIEREALRATVYIASEDDIYMDIEDRDGWDRFGKAIGRNTSMEELVIFWDEDEDEYEDEDEDANSVSSTASYECLEAFYKGLQLSTSIHSLHVDMNLFPDNGALPPMNVLFGNQFKERLSYLVLEHSYKEDDFISDNQSVMISSVLQSMSLESLVLFSFRVDPSNEIGFRRILSACLKVNNLDMRCYTISQCAMLADLLRNPTSILRELRVDFNDDWEEQLPTIIASLVENKTLKNLHIQMDYTGRDMRLIEELLCHTSSIYRIYNSNHTLEEINRVNKVLTPFIDELLELNKNPNKEEVIQAKIARYYFVGDFDVSPFANMAISLLPKVLEMIKCNATNRQSAIFRMLKSIPELCNVTSRSVGHVGVAVHKVSDSNKRKKFSN